MHLQLISADFSALSDQVLELFASHPLKDPDGLAHPLARRLHDCFVTEQARRLRVCAGGNPEPVVLTLPLMDEDQIQEAAAALTIDCIGLENAGVVLEGCDPAGAEQFRQAAGFLSKVGMALKSQAEVYRNVIKQRPN